MANAPVINVGGEDYNVKDSQARQDILNEITNRQNADTIVMSRIAPVFNSSNTYAAGDYVSYNGNVYRFTAAHSGAWTGSDVAATTAGEGISNEVSARKSADDSINKKLLPLVAESNQFIIHNMPNDLHVINGVYNLDTRIVVPTSAFPAVSGLRNGHKYRVFFTPTEDMQGNGYFRLLANGSWSGDPIKYFYTPTTKSNAFVDILWSSGNDDSVSLCIYMQESADRDKDIYVAAYDITDVPAYIVDQLTTKGLYVSSSQVLKTTMIPKAFESGYDGSGQQYTPNVPIDSETSGIDNIFMFRYMKNTLVANGTYMIAVVRLTISSLTLHEGATAPNGIKGRFFHMWKGQYRTFDDNYYFDKTGQYTIVKYWQVSDAPSATGHDSYVGISFPADNYIDFDSVITIDNLDYIFVSAEEFKENYVGIYNAYKHGYDLPMLKMPAVDDYKNSGSWYYNKKYASYGDSITNLGYYQKVLQEMLGFSFDSYKLGVDGRTVVTMSTDEAIATIPQDSDVIIFMGGTNDWAQDIPLGTVNDTTNSTFYGALNLLAQKLSTNFKSKMIVFCTTPYGCYPGRTGFSEDGQKNSLGLTTKDYGDCIKEIGNKFGIPVVDVFGNCGWNYYNMTEWLSYDGAYIHPYKHGGYKIGDIISGYLKSIEPSGLN